MAPGYTQPSLAKPSPYFTGYHPWVAVPTRTDVPRSSLATIFPVLGASRTMATSHETCASESLTAGDAWAIGPAADAPGVADPGTTAAPPLSSPPNVMW